MCQECGCMIGVMPEPAPECVPNIVGNVKKESLLMVEYLGVVMSKVEMDALIEQQSKY